MKKITLILILIAAFAIKSFAYCPIPQWCPSAPLHQTLCPGDTIETIEFPSVIAKTLIVTWWTDETRTYFFEDPPPGITVSGDASTPLGEREYSFPVSIKGAPTAIGTHHYTVSNTCGVELLHGSITLNALPTIGMVTPTIDQTTTLNIAFDSTLTLTAELAGTPPITIQWYSSTTASSAAGASGTAVSGATGNTFTPPANTVNTNGIYYYAVASNDCGSTATTNISGKHIVAPGGCDFVAAIRNRVTITSGGPVTTDVWTIPARAGVAAQTWSDLVVSPPCDKTDYNGGSNPNFDVDCRNSDEIPFPGHYFSWCAVRKYADILCPGTWRIPTVQDFLNLNILMGGTGWMDSHDPSTAINEQSYTSGTNQDNTATTHVPRGGTWGGSRFTGFSGNPTNAGSYYWSFSESYGSHAYTQHYNPAYVALYDYDKSSGFALRCVRDN
ncbi:MAG: hypothetical protein FWG79_08080 [Bacteroidales bacterium]|nr:hypothetical protein [Bacteroidales bacterium]